MNELKSMFGLFAPCARAAAVLACIGLAAAVAGCAPQKVSSSPYATQPEVDRNATRAEQLTRRAVEVMDASTADNAREKDAEAEARFTFQFPIEMVGVIAEFARDLRQTDARGEALTKLFEQV